jgi:hypothetical protein
MAMKLTNRRKSFAIVRLNSGLTYHLAPGESSGPLDELELSGNKKISKLLNSGHLSLSSVEQKQD